MKILIAIVSIIAFGATAGAIVIGEHTFDGVVVNKPYRTALKWDKVHEEKARLGWHVKAEEQNFRMGANDLVIAVSDKHGNRLDDADVSVKVTRPSTTAYDRSYETVRQGDGRYRAPIDLPLQGYWDLIINVKKAGDSVDFDKTVYAFTNNG